MTARPEPRAVPLQSLVRAGVVRRASTTVAGSGVSGEGPGRRWAGSAGVATPRWDLDEVAGRLVDLAPSASTRARAEGELVTRPGATLALATALLADAQRRREPVAWITPPGSTFHPPDVAEHGVDLAALPVIRVLSQRQAWQAADELLRCGAFGLLVLDGCSVDAMPLAVQVRLSGLARQHDVAVVCVALEDAAVRRRRGAGMRGRARREPSSPSSNPSSIATSTGSLASLRLAASIERLPNPSSDPGAPFRCRLEATKDRRRSRGWQLALRAAAPAGVG